MSRLVQGGEIVQAIAASAMRAAQIGYDEAIVELGFEPDQVRAACRAQAIDFLRKVPINASLVELEASIGSAEVEGVIAGVRLGRMYNDKMRELAELAIEVLDNERKDTGVDEWDESDPRCFLYNAAAEVLGL